MIHATTVSNDVGKCPCNHVGGSCHLHGHSITNARCELPYHSSNSQTAASRWPRIQQTLSANVQDSMLFIRHRKIFVLKYFRSRSGLQKFFNKKIFLTKIFQYENFPIYSSCLEICKPGVYCIVYRAVPRPRQKGF